MYNIIKFIVFIVITTVPFFAEGKLQRISLMLLISFIPITGIIDILTGKEMYVYGIILTEIRQKIAVIILFSIIVIGIGMMFPTEEKEG